MSILLAEKLSTKQEGLKNMKTDKKIVNVVAAVICDDMKSPKKIFATQRGYGEFKGGWEFPGGKIEQGETSQEALKREIIEELATKIKVGGVDYYYTVSLSIKNCTGCGVCIETCPSKEKALIPCKLDENTKDSKQKEFDYLNAFVTEKNLFNTSTIKGSQFVKPKFAYCGACSGCGEPAYIKLLTQLFGKQLIVANATGCSSIYGGSAPVTPYSIPWANSLFEDNAEYGFGIYLGISKIRKRIYKIMSENMDNENSLYEIDEQDINYEKLVVDNKRKKIGF